MASRIMVINLHVPKVNREKSLCESPKSSSESKGVLKLERNFQSGSIVPSKP